LGVGYWAFEDNEKAFTMMKRRFFVSAICCLLVCTACAPKGGVPWIFEKEKPGEDLFRSARANFKENRYNTAFSLYQQYLSRYPDGEMVPEALLQMGIVRSRQRKYDRAAAYLNQVMDRYPQSRYARQAGVELMSALYNAGSFEAAIFKAADIFAYGLDDRQFVRASLVTGDAYMALNVFQGAYDVFLVAYQRAGRKKAAEDVLPRLKAAIGRLSVDYIRNELERLDGSPPSGYLMYQLGANYAASGNIGDAIGVFSDFLVRYPDHGMAGSAKDRLEGLKSTGAAEQINIGCLLPLSGKYETFGNRALDGIETALSMPAANAAEQPINLIVADTASEPKQAVKAVEMFDERHVAAIIGPIVAAQAAAESAQAHGIPIITLSQASGIPERGEYVFRNFITPGMQVRTLAAYASETLDIDRFAVLYPAESYGDTFMNRFWDELLAHDASVVGLEDYDPSLTDFSEAIKKLVGLYYDVPEDIAEAPPIGPVAPKESPFEALWGGGEPFSPYLEGLGGTDASAAAPIIDFRAVFIPDSPEKAGLIIPQLVYYDIDNVYFLGTNLWHSDRFIRMARRHVQGAICPTGFFAHSRSHAVRRFVERFKAVYGSQPAFIEAIGYDTAKLLIDLLHRSPYYGRIYIREQLAKMPPYDGVTGKTRFDDTGEAVKTLYLLKVRGDRFVEVGY